MSRTPTLRCVKRWLAPTLLFVGIVALALVWKVTPLGRLVSVDALVARAHAWRHQPAALVVAPLVFVLLSLALVPITLLRVATVLAFGPLWGPLFALGGSAVGAWIGYEAGRRAGADAFERVAGRYTRVGAVRDRLAGGGVWAVCAMRLLPLGPFTFVNAACGAAGVPRRDFLLGTTLVMIPVLVLLALALTVAPVLKAWFV
jgi:phospholipase D1/2